MSSAILKFQQPSEANEQALDPAILVAAVEESPEPIALTENGKLIYANRSLHSSRPIPPMPRVRP
jgi:hypothetical protein